MGKDKKKSGSTGKGRNLKSTDRDRGKGKGKGHDRAVAEIATAEKRLAKALAAVDSAREQLIVREQELRGLLQKHGRLPVLDTNGNGGNDVEADDRHEDESALPAAENGDIPPVSSQRTEDDLGLVGATGDGRDDERASADTGPDNMQGVNTASIPLFDQRQVVTAPSGRQAGVSGG